MQKIRCFIVCCKLFCNQGKLREDTFQLLSDGALRGSSRHAAENRGGTDDFPVPPQRFSHDVRS
jgi:hypothetical protein